MIPVHLKLKNFLSYQGEVSLDFSEIRIACLSGDNGSGKSALLDAITWVIWGKARATNDREVITIGQSEMEVTFCFALGDREYRVFRRRSLTGSSGSGRQTLELYVRAPGDDDWLPISGDNVRETQEKLVALLNMDYETFVNSAFILQGRADSFTQKPPGERKKILGDILNLQEYDELSKMAREEHRSIENRLNSIRGRMDVLDEQLVLRAQVEDGLEVTSAELTQVSEKLDLAQELAKTLALQLTAYQRIRELLDAARAREQRERTALESLAMRRQREDVERTRLRTLVSQADEIERGAAEHERWRRTATELAQALRKVQQQVAIQNRAEREIADARSQLQRDRERHLQARSSAEEQIRRLEGEERKLAELRRQVADAGDPRAALVSVRQTIEQFRHDRSVRHAENGQLKLRMAEIKENLQRIEAGEADCPVCRRALAPADRERVMASWQADGKVLGDHYRENKQLIQQMDINLKALTDDEQRYEAADRENATRLGTIRQIEGQLAARDGLQQQVTCATTEIERLDLVLSTDDYAHDARRGLMEVEAALAELRYDPDAHEYANQQEAHYAPFDARKRDLDQARIRLEGVDASIAAIAEQQVEREAVLAEARKEVEGLEGQLTLDPDLARRAQEAGDECERLEGERNALWARQGGLEQELAKLDAFQLERDDLDVQATQLALDGGALRELIDAFGRNGIQAMIVENVLPELEDEANRLLRQMSSGALNVEFRSQRQALSSDNIIETLDIVIRDEYGERPYALYSGGEAFRVNFAVRIALSKLLARRAGANVDMLVIDEGFGTQDSRGRDGLIEALRSVESDFRTILVITHIGEVRELFPTRIDVVKTDRGSRISVN